MKSDRKFETWSMNPAFSDAYIDIEVRMTKPDVDSSEVSFYAIVARRDKLPELKVENTDIAKLHDDIQAALDAEDPVAWTPKLLVCVGSMRAFRPPSLPDWEPEETAGEGYNLSFYSYDQGVSDSGRTFWRTPRPDKARGSGGWRDADGRSWNVRSGVLYDPAKQETVGQLSGKFAVVLMDDSPQARQHVQQMMADIAECRRETIKTVGDGTMMKLIEAAKAKS